MAKYRGKWLLKSSKKPGILGIMVLCKGATQTTYLGLNFVCCLADPKANTEEIEGFSWCYYDEVLQTEG